MNILQKFLFISVLVFVVIIFLSATNVYHNPFLLKGTLGGTIVVYTIYMVQRYKQKNA